MENIKSKTLPWFLFGPALLLILAQPLTNFVYPVSEAYYELGIILFASFCFFAVRKPGQKNVYLLPILVLLAADALSMLLTKNPGGAFLELFRFLSYVCYFLIITRMDYKQKVIIIRVILIAAAEISLYAIYQHFIVFPQLAEKIQNVNSGTLSVSPYLRDILTTRRVVGTFSSPNLLGGYLLMVFFLCLHFIAGMGASRKWSLVLIPLLIALIMTKSLGVWLSFITCLLVLAAVSSPAKKIKWTVFVPAILVTIVVLILTVFERGDRVIDLNNPQNPLVQRLLYWQTAADIIREHPVTGAGLGNFQLTAHFLKAHPFMADVRYAHNIFLHAFVETGLLGFIGMILLVYTFLKQFNNNSKYLFCAGLVFLIHNQFDFTYSVFQVGAFWWIILGLMATPDGHSLYSQRGPSAQN